MKRVVLRHLMCYVYNRASQEAQGIFWCMLFWIARIMDFSPVLDAATSDPFAQPELLGTRGRQLETTDELKSKVCDLAAKGDVFKSGQSVLKGLVFLGQAKRWMNRKGHATKRGNKWIEPYSLQYFGKLLSVLAVDANRVPIFAVTWDGTRLSGPDTLRSAIYSPAEAIAGWMPPQAILATHTHTFVHCHKMSVGF